MIEVQAPNIPKGEVRLFLAGSIEMGAAEDWQEYLLEALSGDEQLVIYNPRRWDWNANWEQSIDSPKFREQVEWELNALHSADIIVMYFDPRTKSPITLLELGLHAQGRKLIVICPEGYWRKGNVDIVCEFYGIRTMKSLDEFIEFMVR